jgi:holin-like protein
MPCLLGVLQIPLFAVFNALGHAAVEHLGLPIPGNLAGMLLLLALLAARAIPSRLMQAGSSFLVRHLAFFFIPIAVGLMNFGPMLRENGFAIAATLLSSAVLGLYVTGTVSQRLTERRRPCPTD